MTYLQFLRQMASLTKEQLDMEMEVLDPYTDSYLEVRSLEETSNGQLYLDTFDKDEDNKGVK